MKPNGALPTEKMFNYARVTSIFPNNVLLAEHIIFRKNILVWKGLCSLFFINNFSPFIEKVMFKYQPRRPANHNLHLNTVK